MAMIAPQQLERELSRGIAPVYAVLAEEPLQALEACDAIRAAARAAGHHSRTILDLGAQGDWGGFDSAVRDRSLFSEREIIDLRLPSGKPGKAGGEKLRKYLERPERDLVLLLQLPKPDKDMRKAAWFQALDGHAVVVHAQPVPPARLGGWIGERLARQGLRMDPQAREFLAASVEGNLLAARQEIEKLALLGVTDIGLPAVQQALSDVARFDLFALPATALRGEKYRALRMVRGMLAEGQPEPLILWALTRDLRALAQAAERMQAGAAMDQATRGFWGTDPAALRLAVRRVSRAAALGFLAQAAMIDRAIKGRAPGNAARLLIDLTLALAGHGAGPDGAARRETSRNGSTQHGSGKGKREPR
jgi:DNA polymerase-3 subunit delta